MFISYRRASSEDLAARVHDYLASPPHDYDVFLDTSNIHSGKFAEIVLREIEARPLFVPILVPGCFDRAGDSDDLFRREIEHALAKKRHIVPVAAKGFSFEQEYAHKKLPGRLGELADLHYIDVPARYFKAAMESLATGLSAAPSGIDVRPAAAAEREVVEKLVEAVQPARPDRSGTHRISPLRMGNLVPSVSEGLENVQWSSSKDRLPAPMLELKIGDFGITEISWSKVPAAARYVLQRGSDASFSRPVEVYRGGNTWFHVGGRFRLAMDDPLPAEYYRVKADGQHKADSEWSNVVELQAV